MNYVYYVRRCPAGIGPKKGSLRFFSFYLVCQAVRLLVQCLKTQQRPYLSWVKLPLGLSGEQTSTKYDPIRTLYRLLTTYDGTPPPKQLTDAPEDGVLCVLCFFAVVK